MHADTATMNPDHVRTLLDGVDRWNAWRRQEPGVRPDLSGYAFNSQAPERTPRIRAPKTFLQMFQTRTFSGIDLHGTDLRGAKIWSTTLEGCDLSGADLTGANVRSCKLQNSDLRGADLRGVYLERSDLTGVRLDEAQLGGTRFGFTTLAGAQGLAQLRHHEPSYLDMFSLLASMPLPPEFLAACRVPDHTSRAAEWWHAQSRPYYTCFISYSRRDETFVGYLREALTWAGVPSWFAPLDLRERPTADSDAELARDLFGYVRSAERVLLVVSSNVIPSEWVPRELDQAQAVVPLLIEGMPAPDSAEWQDVVARQKARFDAEYGQNVIYAPFNPQRYADRLAQLLKGPVVSCLAWRDPFAFGNAFVSLLAMLRRVPDAAPGPSTAS